MISGENIGAGNPELIQRQVIENYGKEFPPLYLDIVRHVDLSTLTWTPLMFRHPWDILFGNLSKGNITVAGDAMHPMTPELAQGACAALEDAVVLGRHIGNSLMRNATTGFASSQHIIAEAIEGYIKERRWRVACLVAISSLSGWVRNGNRSWWMNFLRELIFYKIILGSKIINPAEYDCGKLPCVSFNR